MRRPVVLAALLAFLATSSNPARADDLPSPGNSSMDSALRLVGADAFGQPDPIWAFHVTYRDLANHPIPGATVFVDFSLATDLQLCAAQGAGVALVAGGVEAITDVNGGVTLSLLGHGVAGALPSAPGSIKVYANGEFLGSVSGSAFDLDGAGGMSGADESRWLADFFTGTFMARLDYDNTAGLGGADLSIWLMTFVRGKQVQSCPSVVTSPN